MQVLIPFPCFSVSALGLNPHACYLSPVTVTHHCHPSPSPVTVTRRQTRCHLCRTHHYSPPNCCCLLRGAETLHLLLLPSLPEFVIAAMSDKSMMKLNNKNYEIWK